MTCLLLYILALFYSEETKRVVLKEPLQVVSIIICI